MQAKDYTPDDPLLACALLLCEIYQKPCSRAALTAGLPLEHGKLTPKLLTTALTNQGLITQIKKRRLRALSSLVMPCIILLANNQACLLQAVEGNTATVIKPESGLQPQTMTLSEIKKHYTGYVIFTKPSYEFDSRAHEFHPPNKTSWFFGTLWHFRYYYLQVLIGTLLINLFALATPLFVMNVYDRVVPNNAMDTLWALAIGIMILFLFDFILKMARSQLIDASGKKIDVLLSMRIFKQVMSIKLSHKPTSAGAFSNNLREFESLRDFFTSASLASLVDLPFIFLFLLIIFLIGGPVALVPLIAIPVTIITVYLISLAIAKSTEISMQGSSQKHALAVEALSALEASRCLGAEGELQRQWEQSLIKTTQANHHSRLLSGIANNFTAWIMQFVTVGVVIVGVYRIEEGLMTMGSLIACSMLSGRCLAPLAQVTGLLTRYQQAKRGLNGLNDVMTLPTERPQGKSFLHRSQLQGMIELKNVSFSYPHDTIPCFEDINLTIQPGEKVGLIGRVGAGKTSLFKLLLHLYEVDSGSVLIDKVDSRQIDPADLRQQIAYSPQDNNLFFGTLKYNMMLGKPWSTDEDILQAAEHSGVARFANRHPLGYNLMIAERGENLSGGQKKAINLARMFLSQGNIVLLDEPTIAMDNTAERHVIQSIRAFTQQKTLLLITHKRSLLSLVDRLIIFDHGKILADGTRDEILAMLLNQSKEGTIS